MTDLEIVGGTQSAANSSKPLISVITVTFNAQKTLEDTILSVINQTYNAVEFIIIDGASTDGTLDIINKYRDRISYVLTEPDKGIYDAMNKALKIANGDRAFFLGSDDVFVNNDVLKTIVNSFTNNNDIYYGNAIFKHSRKVYDVEVNKYFFCLKNISHQTVFYPKALYKTHFYELNYRLFADHIYNLKIYAKSSFKFVHLPVTVVLYNDSGSSAEGNDPAYFKDLPAIVSKHLGFVYGIYVYFRIKFFLLKRKLSK